jgi:hypothetical protein
LENVFLPDLAAKVLGAQDGTGVRRASILSADAAKAAES